MFSNNFACGRKQNQTKDTVKTIHKDCHIFFKGLLKIFIFRKYMHASFSFVSFKGKRLIFSIFVKDKIFSCQFKRTWFYKTINRPSGSDF